ncbi:kinase-like protein [Calocera cornea HHB12733]|uniref:Kinase-like protein n=1 Tax=Calocera cornea HHB12733 TaxID=1353952 RepID=A0A165EI53_9BASI|nr:kinase-like protein [Calocera cornea HHB12733]
MSTLVLLPPLQYLAHTQNSLEHEGSMGGDDLMQHITKVSVMPTAVGSLGDIWTGYYGDIKVAIKAIRVLSKPSSTQCLKRFTAEMRCWSQLGHVNILTPFGLCEHVRFGIATVWPWLDERDVMRYLATYPSLSRLPLVLDIAHGLSYLHSRVPPVVHGDLRARNVLIRSSGQACIADFGLSRTLLEELCEDMPELGPTRGYARWMAPERLDPEAYSLAFSESFSPASDAYSFGMVVYEMYAGRKPFYQTRNNLAIFSKVASGERPPRPDNIIVDAGQFDAMWNIAQDCWNANPTNRPTAMELVRRVEVLATDSTSPTQDVTRIEPHPDDKRPLQSLRNDETSKTLGTSQGQPGCSVTAVDRAADDARAATAGVVASETPVTWSVGTVWDLLVSTLGSKIPNPY